MEIRIGVQHSPREITLESKLTSDELSSLVERAITEDGMLKLEDAKGRTVLVPGPRLSYVEYSTEEPRRVGFLG